jgi:hypothetical protein
MYALKGFISNTPFSDNTPGAKAKLGELSKHSRTFSRESGEYSDQDIAPNLTLTTFISKNGDVSVEMPALITKQTLEVANFIYAQTLGGQLDILPAVMLENLLTDFVGKASEFECGNMVSNGVYTLPEWVSWKCLNDPAHPDNFLKVWFVDNSFQQQYDEYEIYVIPPLAVLNNFFKPGSEVEAMIDNLTSSDTMERIQAAKAGYPETVVRTNTYNYIDPLNSAHVVPTDWSVLIYGAAGDNVDAIKDALMAYILANSTHTRNEWTKIFPDIFKRTEFILLPLWDQYAIPNRELATGIYSPQIQLATVVSKMKQFATQYPEAHIDSHLTMMGHPYRSLALVSIGSPDNRNTQFKLLDIFPDLIAVSSTSVDFNRMSQITQDWASMLANMLVTAESMSEFASIPSGMMKVTRDGILYLTKSYRNINYLMVAKSNLNEVG